MEGPPTKPASRRGFIYIFLVLALLLGSVPAHRSTWRGTVELHTLLETIATLLGLISGVKALIRYYAKKSDMFLFLGTGFLGGAILNGYHTLVTSTYMAGRTPMELADMTPWSGIMSRVFLSILMCTGMLAWKWKILRPAQVINERLVYSLVAAGAIVSFAFFALLEVSPPFDPNHIVHRPADFVPALFFFVAAIGYFWKGSWKVDVFEQWLVIAMILFGMSHFAYMSFYGRPFDAQYFIGHALNILGFLAVLTGLFISMFSVYKAEVRAAADLFRANQLLAEQLDQERRLVQELEKAEHRATHDFLSGIYNRGAIMDLLDREAARCKRTGEEAAVLMLDIDRFKGINDTCGHAVGDRVIQEVVLRISSGLRPYDSVGRFGGEEFLVLVPNCNEAGAVVVAERVRLGVGSEKFMIGALLLPVTVSVGVSILKGPSPDVNLTLSNADSALYQAKKNGRNRIECFVSNAVPVSS